MSIDIDQDSERPEGNSRALSSGALYLVVGVAEEVIAALDPDADQLPSSFDHAVIAWDHSQQATRAIADAMWLLQRVKTVRVFMATDNKTPAERGVRRSPHQAYGRARHQSPV